VQKQATRRAAAQSRRRLRACTGGRAAGCLVPGRKGAGSGRRLYQAGVRTLCASVHARSAPGVLRAGPRLSARSRAGLERHTAYQCQRCRHAQVHAVQGALWDAYAEVAIYMEVLQVAAAPLPGRGGALLLHTPSARAPGSACTPRLRPCFGCHFACRACMHRSMAPGRCADAAASTVSWWQPVAGARERLPPA